VGPHGHSITIPDDLLTPILSDDFKRAKIQIFSGQSNGKVVYRERTTT